MLSGRLKCRCYQQGEDDSCGEIGQREYQKRESANSCGTLPSPVYLLRRHVRIGFEVRLDIDLANISRNVEQEWKPANPSKELDLADFGDLWWKASNRLVKRSEECYDARFLYRRFAFKSRVTLAHCGAGQSDSDDESQGSQYA